MATYVVQLFFSDGFWDDVTEEFDTRQKARDAMRERERWDEEDYGTMLRVHCYRSPPVKPRIVKERRRTIPTITPTVSAPVLRKRVQ